MQTRIHFLDNLRTFLILLVIVLHAGIVYEPILENTWIVSDPDKNSTLGLLRMYLDIFVMFIMFYISGYFIPISLKGKNAWSFLKSKFNRIMIPWIVAVFTLIPIYKVIFLFARGLPQEEWYSYFHLFQRTSGNMSYFADNPTQSWLWFLPVLFMFQALYLIMAKANILNFKISLKTGVFLTFAIGLIYSLVISALDIRGWFNSPLLHFQRDRLLIYFMAFLLGSLSYKLKVFESSNKNKKLYIWTNVTLSVAISLFTMVALNLFFNMIEPGRNHYFVSETIDKLMYYGSLLLSMLNFLYIFIYIFRFSFNKINRLTSQLNKNSYQVYIIHLIVLGIVALILQNLGLPVIVKLIILTVLTFVFSNILVYIYRSVFQRIPSMNVVSLAIPVAAILLTIVVYTMQANSVKEIESASISQATTSAPNIGIHEAVIQGDMVAIRQHIIAGSDLDKIEANGGSSPLITATVFGKTDIAIALVEAGSNVNYKNNEGSTPLHTAAFFGRTDIVKALLANGSDLTIMNNTGSTALESVLAPFEMVKPYYDYFMETLGPLGLELDYDQLKITRRDIAEILNNATVE